MRAISGKHGPEGASLELVKKFQLTALTTLQQILRTPDSQQLADLQLEHVIIDRLTKSLDEPESSSLQDLLLKVLYISLEIRIASTFAAAPPTPIMDHKRPSTQDTPHNPRLSISTDRTDPHPPPRVPPPPPSLINCLLAGIAASSSKPVLDNWVNFLTKCLPLYSDGIFQILIPLVETFCGQIERTFRSLQATFKESGPEAVRPVAPESTLISLLNGLENVLARGHDHLIHDELKIPAMKHPDQAQGFFGNMVSNVFTSEAPQARSASANNRLTVLLSFQDAVRICFLIWSWGGADGARQDADSAASFNYTSLRMRNRARRLLEHLFAAETLECLETVVDMWQKSLTGNQDSKSMVVFNLLHVLDGSRPKHTIPAIFNAIYSRSNPSALDPARKSTFTSSLNDTDLVIFLVEYTRSLEDDTMDEIWLDCMTFLKDLLTNPFPHRQTLPSLLEFAAILGEKVDNTNFGEQRKMRRDLAV